MASEAITVAMDKTKETKGTCMYTERGAPSTHKIGVIYVKKATLQQLTLSAAFPSALKVTVAVDA